MMAAAQRIQNIKMVTAAAICMLLTILISTAWGTGQMALAGTTPEAAVANNEPSGVLIAWNEGKTTLEHITSLAAENPQVSALLDDLPGGLESLQEGRWPAPGIQAVSLPEGTLLD